MSKKLLIFIIVLAGIALSGIILVQLYYIKNAFIQNEVLFDQKVNDALQAVVQKLEQIETVEKIHTELEKSKKKPKNQKFSTVDVSIDNFFDVKLNDSVIEHLIMIDEASNHGFVWSASDENTVVVNDDSASFQHKYFIKPGNIRLHSNAELLTIENDTVINKNGGVYQLSYKYSVDSNKVLTVKKEIVEKTKTIIKNVVKKMVDESDKNFIFTRKQINYKLIDSLLNTSLNERDISLPFEYNIVADSVKNKTTPKTPGFKNNSEYKKYETQLFPNDIIPKKDKIIIYFPDRQNHLFKSLSFLLPSSLFFSLIIIIAFSISIMMVIRQKKISDIKTDFINNMTHEFKTPIATISLAADTIINPKVIHNQEKISHFIRIIKDENKRMNIQVEKILQMAQLDRRELELNMEAHDMHELILKAIGNIEMQLRQLNGKIITSFDATYGTVLVDEVHFTNVINNLLDNALKYTINPPEIKISSHVADKGIFICFEDNGVGMSSEVQSRIFEKFYRLSKGNIHNIKGFGLGLSYVKAIVEAHNGTITVKSEQNKGSKFEIYLPQKNNNNGK